MTMKIIMSSQDDTHSVSNIYCKWIDDKNIVSSS